MERNSAVSSEILSHHGLVAAIGKNLKIEEKINARIPVQDRQNNITRGQSVMAMVLNGLGFIERRLYMVGSFFKDKPIGKLLGENVTCEQLNDDNLGRTLDAIHDYGVTKLFSEIAFEIGLENNAMGKFAHLDSTSFSVEGEYDIEGEEIERGGNFNITHGHSKDLRPDLKQLVLSLTTTGPASIPIWLEALSGNIADKSSFNETIKTAKKFQEGLQGAEPFIWVADSALYSKDKLLSKQNKVLWVTRVPETISEAKNLVQQDKNSLDWHELPNGYWMSPQESLYGGVKQRWFLIFSEQAFKNEVNTIELMIDKKEKSLNGIIKKTEKDIFYCEKDAQKYFKNLCKKHPLFILDAEVEAVYRRIDGKQGRPREDEKVMKGFCLKIKYKKNESEIKKHENARGRFILATNDFDLERIPDDLILKEYKEQSKTENSFRFLKDTSFFASEIYLKNPDRIQAMMFIMGLCLMIYNVGQYHIRKVLKDQNDTIPNQVNKKIQTPTLKWIFQCFRSVIVVKIFDSKNNCVREIVTNLTELHMKIIKYFGEIALNIYGLEEINDRPNYKNRLLLF